MKGTIQKKYFIGSTKPGKWASVYAYRPHNPDLREKKGEIFAAIALTSPTDFAISTAGNLLLDHLHESYFENAEPKVLLALEKATISTSRHLQKLLENDSAAETGIDLDLISLVITNDLAYFVSLGQSTLFLFRDGNLTNVASALKDPTGQGILKVGSMVVKRADVFIVGTPAVDNELSTDELIDMAIDFTEVQLRRKTYDDESKVALMLVGYNVDRKEARDEFAAVQGNKNVQLPVAAVPEKPSVEVEADVDEDEDQDIDHKPTTVNEQVMAIREGQSVLPTEHDAIAEAVDSDSEGPDSEPAAVVEPELESESEPITKPKSKSLQERLSPIMAGLKLKGSSVKNMAIAKLRKRPVSPTRQVQSETPNLEQPTYKVIAQSVFSRVKKLAKAVKGTVWDNWLGMGHSGIYLKGSNRRRNWRFIVVVILVVVGILYFSIKGVSERNQRLAVEAEAKLHLDKGTELVNAVDQTAAIIAKATNNEDRKNALIKQLTSANSELELAKKVDQYKAQAASEEVKASQLKDLLNRTIAVTAPKLVVDVGGIFPGADPSDFTILNQELFITDKANGKIYRTGYSGNNLRELVSGLQSPKSITADDKGNVIILDENGDKRMATVNTTSGTVTRYSGTSAFRLGNIPQITFANIFGGRVYGVDKSLKAVVALQRTGDTYGIPEKRFSVDGLDTATDIQIADLKIYLLAQVKQGLYRSLNNKDDTPVLNGLQTNETLFGATALYVDAERVYIADPTHQRILVFTKGVTSMDLIAQYVYRGTDANGFRNIKALSTDRDAGKIFVLDGTKVYTLQLSDLTNFQ